VKYTEGYEPYLQGDLNDRIRNLTVKDKVGVGDTVELRTHVTKEGVFAPNFAPGISAQFPLSSRLMRLQYQRPNHVRSTRLKICGISSEAFYAWVGVKGSVWSRALLAPGPPSIRAKQLPENA
jgi:hypothetical protein